jgi:hypothetical protein
LFLQEIFKAFGDLAVDAGRGGRDGVGGVGEGFEVEEVDVFFGFGGVGEEFVVEVVLGCFGELFVVGYLPDGIVKELVRGMVLIIIADTRRATTSQVAPQRASSTATREVQGKHKP